MNLFFLRISILQVLRFLVNNPVRHVSCKYPPMKAFITSIYSPIAKALFNCSGLHTLRSVPLLVHYCLTHENNNKNNQLLSHENYNKNNQLLSYENNNKNNQLLSHENNNKNNQLLFHENNDKNNQLLSYKNNNKNNQSHHISHIH
jgi:hypothetical protein